MVFIVVNTAGVGVDLGSWTGLGVVDDLGVVQEVKVRGLYTDLDR